MWAELLAPGVVPAPVEIGIAVVTVQPGQIVRARGDWRTVRSVRSERYASGGLFVIVGLDDGPALRLHAAETVTVRAGGGAPCCPWWDAHMSEKHLRDRIERYYATVPLLFAEAEEIGALRLFVRKAAGAPYYGGPPRPARFGGPGSCRHRRRRRPGACPAA
ncbi:hypothetical protein NKH18_34745 [Streptomyces sp. M10(2022)]